MQDLNPLAGVLDTQPVVVLDGGLATELEARGCVLDDDLWSARVLLDAPELIADVHMAYLRAGADIITSSTYQASIAGLRRRGLSDSAALGVLRLSVTLALEARERFWNDPANRRGRARPLVAAGVGPYGAFLADGSEYTGAYDIDDAGLDAFHRERWRVLAASDADLLACETIPSRREVNVLLELLRQTAGKAVWISLCCRDEKHLGDGSLAVDVARDCDTVPGVAAVGINCTPPKFISSLITELRRGTTRPIIVYPNSGETYDAKRGTWSGTTTAERWGDLAAEWVQLGAVGVGGCCRVTPRDIATLRHRMARGFISPD